MLNAEKPEMNIFSIAQKIQPRYWVNLVIFFLFFVSISLFPKG